MVMDFNSGLRSARGDSLQLSAEPLP